VEILNDSNVKWEKPGDTISHGYIAVRLRHKPSFKLREIGFSEDGIFDVEIDAVTIIRSRAFEVPVKSRYERREDKHRDYLAAQAVRELMKKA
jgi:hypothetical protein